MLQLIRFGVGFFKDLRFLFDKHFAINIFFCNGFLFVIYCVHIYTPFYFLNHFYMIKNHLHYKAKLYWNEHCRQGEFRQCLLGNTMSMANLLYGQVWWMGGFHHPMRVQEGSINVQSGLDRWNDWSQYVTIWGYLLGVWTAEYKVSSYSKSVLIQ